MENNFVDFFLFSNKYLNIQISFFFFFEFPIIGAELCGTKEDKKKV